LEGKSGGGAKLFGEPGSAHSERWRKIAPPPPDESRPGIP